MKIQAVSMKTNKPITNNKIQLQVKGKDSGYLSFATDVMGYFELDSKFNGQQIAYYLHGTSKSEWVTAKDGIILRVPETSTDVANTPKSTTQSYK